jgi:hypothetical protein
MLLDFGMRIDSRANCEPYALASGELPSDDALRGDPASCL